MLILAPDTQTPNLKCLFLENNLNFITSIDIKPEIIDYKGLTKKDINLVTLYNNVYLVIFGLSQNYVYIYTVDVMSKNNFYLMFFLKCENFKNMSLNTIDNMIALHNFTKKITYLYDINIFTHSDATGIKTCQQLFKISTLPVENIVHKNREEMDIFSSMYIFFNPDILIDSLNGAVYQFHLNMDAVQDAFQLSYSALLNFLSHRIDGKYAILSYLSTSLPLNKNTIGTIREMFLCILYYNDLYKNKQVTLESQFPNPINAVANYIDQHDILVNIFFPLINSTQYLSSEELYYHLCFCETVVFTYISCMLSYNIQAKHFICECLVDVMIKLGKIDQLNEIIGSKLLPDNRDFTLYLTKICKNYPILIKNVMNICCRVNCLGAFIELAAQACTPETIKEIIKSINSLPLITDTGKQIHLLEELKLKINDNSYMDFTINNVELESICYLLRNTAIKNLYD
ncbi:hypothetical protein HZS_6962 [Henneguya salminicola]|nr:hypothetical protein HZS_6962 [Henneguya salminicola]